MFALLGGVRAKQEAFPRDGAPGWGRSLLELRCGRLNCSSAWFSAIHLPLRQHKDSMPCCRRPSTLNKLSRLPQRDHL